MNKKTRNIILGIIGVALLGMLAFVYIQRAQLSEEQTGEQQEQNVDEEEENDRYNIDRIEAKHFFQDGKHTVIGEVTMPTPCDLIEAETRVMESMPEQVVISLSAINNSEDMCAQALTPQRFNVSFDASEEANISAEFMGEDVELNLIEAEDGETPEDFELFIKG